MHALLQNSYSDQGINDNKSRPSALHAAKKENDTATKFPKFSN